tara:strand:+ start:440 stop:709 length:270 start_codon:yes stop_codon:yes gene_type:complete
VVGVVELVTLIALLTASLPREAQVVRVVGVVHFMLVVRVRLVMVTPVGRVEIRAKLVMVVGVVVEVVLVVTPSPHTRPRMAFPVKGGTV